MSISQLTDGDLDPADGVEQLPVSEERGMGNTSLGRRALFPHERVDEGDGVSLRVEDLLEVGRIQDDEGLCSQLGRAEEDLTVEVYDLAVLILSVRHTQVDLPFSNALATDADFKESFSLLEHVNVAPISSNLAPHIYLLLI